MFGAGGGTSSYREIEDTDLIVLWGSNARETHPIFFHHLLHGVHNGARLYAVDPRRTSSADWADVWLGLDVGSDIALANAVGREIIAAGLDNREFIERATERLRRLPGQASSRTRSSTPSARPASRPSTSATWRTPTRRRRRAMICWTLGITEHHNARRQRPRADQPRPADRARRPLRVAASTRCAARTTSRAAATWAPSRTGCPASSTSRTTSCGRRFDAAWGVTGPAEARLAPVRRCSRRWSGRADRRSTSSARTRSSPRPTRPKAIRLLSGLDLLVVQDIFLTQTAELADVVLPAAAAWAESEGTVTNSERRVQRVRKALEPPGEARDDLAIIFELARRMGADWGEPSRGGGLGRGAAALAGPRRDELRAPRGARAGSSGRATTRPTRASCSSTRGSGRTRSRATARRSSPSTTTRRSTRWTTTSRSG